MHLLRVAWRLYRARRLIRQVQRGMLSVDEARRQLGLRPWDPPPGPAGAPRR